jgi:hypothetical protein
MLAVLEVKETPLVVLVVPAEEATAQVTILDIQLGLHILVVVVGLDIQIRLQDKMAVQALLFLN